MYQPVRIKINKAYGGVRRPDGWTLTAFDMAERKAIAILVTRSHPGREISKSEYSWSREIEHMGNTVTTTRKADAIKLARQYAEEYGYAFDKDIDIHEIPGEVIHGKPVNCALCGTKTSFRSHGNEPKFCIPCGNAIEQARAMSGEYIDVAVQADSLASMIAAVTGAVLDDKVAHDYVSHKYTLGELWRSNVKEVRVRMTVQQYEAAVKLFDKINARVDAAKQAGLERGRDWLRQAVAGEIKLSDLEKGEK